MTATYSNQDSEDTADQRPGNPGPRKDGGKMDVETLEGILKNFQQDAIDYVDQTLSPDRALAHKYYKQEPFGNEEQGRSQVVMSDVADAVTGMMPELIRMFTGPRHMVEFIPTRQETVDSTAQMTDMVRHIFEQENPGFEIIHDSMWDGLVKATGIVKWGWEDYCEKHYTLCNLTQDQIDALETEDGVTISGTEPEDEKVTVDPTSEEIAQWHEAAQAAQQQGQQPPPAPQPQQVEAFRVEVTYRLPSGRPCVWAVPPEELLVLRAGRNVQEGTLYVGHRMRKTRGELLALDFTAEEIDEHGGAYSALDQNPEAIERIPDGISDGENAQPGDEHFKHDLIENYVTIDFNGDGYSELRKILTLGADAWVKSNKIVSSRPFAVWAPYPEPHQTIGRSVAHRTMDLEKINSSLVRSGLDSLAASIFPRTAYQDGMVSVADLMNTEIGSTIRVKGQPDAMIKSFTHNFNGKEIFPFLEFFKQAKTERTGVDQGAAGLDMDSLQSTTPDAAAAAISSNKMQIELIARQYAERILKPVFKGIARMVAENNPQPRIVRLRGKFVTIDPRVWDVDSDMTVNVAIGDAESKKLQTLLGVKADQDQILQLLGPTNPLVSLAQAANTRYDILEAQGILEGSRYYNRVDPNWQPPQQAPQPTEAEIAAKAAQEIERMKVMGDLAMKKEELELKKQELAQKAQIELAKIDAGRDPAEKMAEIQARQQEKLAEIQQRAAATQLELDQKGQLAREQMQLDLQIAREKNEMEINKAREQAHLQAQTQRHAAEVTADTQKHVAAVGAETQKHVAEKTAQAKATEPKPEPKPAAAPKLPDVHIHLPGGGKKVSKLTKNDDGSMSVESEQS